MGIDAWLLCKDCDIRSECLGRANLFREEFLNKRIPNETFEYLNILKTRIMTSLTKNIFSATYSLGLIEDILDFWKEHNGETIFLITDFYEENEKI